MEVLTKQWKWRSITHWHDFRNRNQPTDSAEETDSVLGSIPIARSMQVIEYTH
jgi:hypothetical protein